MTQTTTLQQLLDLHFQHENDPMALPKSLCDGLFLSLSPIARQVRQEFLNSKFKFKLPDSGLEKDLLYQNHIFVLPLQFQKEELYYKNNVDTYLKLIDVYPSLKSIDIRLAVPLGAAHIENKLLHESIHLLTFEEIFNEKTYHFNENFSAEETHQWLISHLATEASVLAIELMSTLVTPSYENIYIINLSCHQTADYPRDYKTLLAFSKEFGMQRLYRILARGFLAANLLPRIKSLDKEQTDLICEDLSENAFALPVCKRSQSLGDAFRIGSNTRYFTTLGYFRPYEETVLEKPLKDHLELPIVQKIFALNEQRFLKNL